MIKGNKLKRGIKPHRKQNAANTKHKGNQTAKGSDFNGFTKDKNVKKNDMEKPDDKDSLANAILDQNRKKKKSGGFQSMGLTQEVFRGIIKKGYKVPTPIQRKTIPIILEGRDVVAMARTGSGKTASFLIPLFHKLKGSRGVGMGQANGARALILTPTRELALQTLKFIRELGRFTGLKSICILGGDAMEKQFSLMHENPDIIVATPGRLVHLCVEMELQLGALQYVVFDEADRLFEMGFGEQLSDILGRLPDTRQTVLFSATLPKLLVDFAKAGLVDPTLVRLDVDAKIPDTLKMAFFHCRPESKPALFLYLLQNVIPDKQQILVFAATRHHVEYLHILLDLAGVSNTYVYSQLDSTARKINVAKFAARRARVLIVTDVAARGIDIPLLDNVINYHFPAKSKLFVHRVGRVARAGRRGAAYSFVAGDEVAYLVDMQLFLGNSIKTVASISNKAKQDSSTIENIDNSLLGTVPQEIYDIYEDQLKNWHLNSLDLSNSQKTAENGYKQYLKSRPGASVESAKRVRYSIPRSEGFGDHPLLLSNDVPRSNSSSDKSAQNSNSDLNSNLHNEFRSNMLGQMKKFRPNSTIFEIGNSAKSVVMSKVMSQKRAKHTILIEKFKHRNKPENAEDDEQCKNLNAVNDADIKDLDLKNNLEESSQDQIDSTFGLNIVQPKAITNAKVFIPKKQKRKGSLQQEPSSAKKVKTATKKDDENYIGYQPKDHHTEAG
jgi:ATP-dependent RNA helicase DDX54/DBP10